MDVTEEMVDAAWLAFQSAINSAEPCGRCSARGYHHGFGEDGHDPDWCTLCGGSGFVTAHSDREAMRLALKEALTKG